MPRVASSRRAEHLSTHPAHPLALLSSSLASLSWELGTAPSRQGNTASSTPASSHNIMCLLIYCNTVMGTDLVTEDTLRPAV